MPAFERRPAGGGPPSRVAPDTHDQIVWYDWAGGTASLTNGGSGGALSCAGHGRTTATPGPFTERGWGTTAQDAMGNDGGLLLSADTMVGEYSAGTLELWWYALASTYAGAGDLPLVGKAYQPSPWGSPYLSVAIHTYADASLVFAGREVGAAAGTFVNLFADPLSAGEWHHLGLTWDGAHWRAYADGAQVDSVAQGAAVDWGAHGAWYLSGYPYQAGTAYRSPFGSVGDVRVANVARDADHFARVWATRRTS